MKGYTKSNTFRKTLKNRYDLMASSMPVDGQAPLVAKSSADTVMNKTAQIARFMGPTWDPPGSCRPQVGPMLAP